MQNADDSGLRSFDREFFSPQGGRPLAPGEAWSSRAWGPSWKGNRSLQRRRQKCAEGLCRLPPQASVFRTDTPGSAEIRFAWGYHSFACLRRLEPPTPNRVLDGPHESWVVGQFELHLALRLCRSFVRKGSAFPKQPSSFARLRLAGEVQPRQITAGPERQSLSAQRSGGATRISN